MERSELIDMLGSLQLAGMRANLDEILTRGRKRRHSVEDTIAAGWPVAEHAFRPLVQYTVAGE